MSIKSIAGFTLLLLLPLISHAEVQVVHAFELGPQKPQCRLVQAADGNFYGTSFSGGDGGTVGGTGGGCIFRVTPAGVITNLASFFGTNGANPSAGLVQGGNGTFYGTTQVGGALNFGTVFSYSVGGPFIVLHSFDNTNGSTPQTSLAFGPDGALYGTTFNGGANLMGTVFRITTTGTFSNLYSFGATNPNPSTALCLGADGNFYGATSQGPANGASHYSAGTLFSITPAGNFTQWVGLTNTIGITPGNTFTLGPDGAVYGTLQAGGANNNGSLFRLATNGAFSVLGNMLFTTTGANPRGGLTLLSGTTFYGTAYSSSGGYGTVYKLGLNTNSFSNSVMVLVDSFNGSATGADPTGGLLLAADGKFYGVTTDGGLLNNGMVYSMPAGGPITPVASLNMSSGAAPESPLVMGPDGSLYGTTFYGGPTDSGSIYRVTTNGNYSVLGYVGGTNGVNPIAPLCFGADGALYGSTYGGGGGNVGTLFRVTTNGVFRTLMTLTNSLTGGSPWGGMALGPDGALYGTTQYGGTNSGQGTVFRLTPSGTNFLFTNLAVFNNTNGATPQGTLLNGGDGFLYGTTSTGGSNNNGTIFRINTNGVLNTIAYFQLTNGYQPQGGLVRGADGALYGGGFGNFSNSRRIYRVTTNGVLTSLFAFPNNYGSEQFGALTAGTDGYLYDALQDGGTKNTGLLFRISTNGIAAIVSSFTTATGTSPLAAPIFGPDGNLYGTTYNSGPGGGGSVYRFVFDHITSISKIGTNAFVTATGTTGGSYGLFASTNLASGVWTNIGSAPATNAMVNLTDVNAGKFPQRFYRTAAQ